jgi:hypothetical protein
MEKRCPKCGATKLLSEFYKRSDQAGHRAHCKSCSVRGDEQRARRNALRAASPERAILSMMIQRCHNAGNPSFSNYGGRGITVCERWRNSFEDFLADMGPRPTVKHSIERQKNDVGYEPGNCTWATRREQNRNTRQNVMLTINGRTQCRSAWAEETGVPANAIRDRMEKLGWDVERAVFTPIQKGRAA